MLQFFYKTKNVIGLILVISPVTGFLFIDKDFVASMILLCAVAAATPLMCTAFRYIKLKMWLFICGFFACYGTLIMKLSSDSPLSFLGAVLCGIGVGGLLLILPPNIAVNWFRKSKTLILGLVWSSSLALGFLWKLFLEGYTYIAVTTGFFLILISSVFFLERPPVNYYQKENPITKGRESSFLKPAVFVASISAAIGLSISLSLLAAYQIQTYDESLSNALQIQTPLAMLFLAISPILISLFIEKKGIFSSCILVIFLCETAVFCLGAYADTPILLLWGRLITAAVIGALGVILPILTYYLYGPANYIESFGRIIFFLPIGLITTLPFQYLAHNKQLDQYEAVIILLILLVISFLCIFSAWKHRFVILKNKLM